MLEHFPSLISSFRVSIKPWITNLCSRGVKVTIRLGTFIFIPPMYYLLGLYIGGTISSKVLRICRQTVAIDFVPPNGISSLNALISTVSLDGIDITVFYPFHDTHMIPFSILADSDFIPVKENNISCLGDIIVVSPLTALNKPIAPVTTTGKLGDDPYINVPTLGSVPGNKSGTPKDTDVIVTSAGYFTNNYNL